MIKTTENSITVKASESEDSGASGLAGYSFSIDQVNWIKVEIGFEIY